MFAEFFNDPTSVIAVLCAYIEEKGDADSLEFIEGYNASMNPKNPLTLQGLHKVCEKSPIFEKFDEKKNVSFFLRFKKDFSNPWLKETLTTGMTKREFIHTFCKTYPEIKEYSLFKEYAKQYGLDISFDSFHEHKRIFNLLKKCELAMR